MLAIGEPALRIIASTFIVAGVCIVLGSVFQALIQRLFHDRFAGAPIARAGSGRLGAGGHWPTGGQRYARVDFLPRRRSYVPAVDCSGAFIRLNKKVISQIPDRV